MGDLLFKLQRPEEARDAFQNAIVFCDQADPPGAGAFRGSLAVLLAQEDRLKEALSFLEVGEPLVKSEPEEHGKFLCKKAHVYHLNHDSIGAKAALQQAQDIAGELNVKADSDLAKYLHETQQVLDHAPPPQPPEEHAYTEDEEWELLEADRLMELGHIEIAESNYDQALEAYQQALHIYQRLQSQKGGAEVRKGIGLVHYRQGSYSCALEQFEQALSIARGLGHKVLEGKTLGLMGNVYLAQGKYDLSLSHCQQSIEISHQIGDKLSEGIHLGNMAIVYLRQGKHEEALSHFQQSIEIAREIGDRRNEPRKAPAPGGSA